MNLAKKKKIMMSNVAYREKEKINKCEGEKCKGRFGMKYVEWGTLGFK